MHACDPVLIDAPHGGPSAGAPPIFQAIDLPAEADDNSISRTQKITTCNVLAKCLRIKYLSLNP